MLLTLHAPRPNSPRNLRHVLPMVSLSYHFMDVLAQLFEQYFRSPVVRVEPLQGQLGGSGRRIVRLIGESARAIGILYDVREENAAFIEFSRHFRKHGLPVPEICASD